MKKLSAILMAVALLASMATVVSAANTTTLTTTVPAATYTLNIPANQEISFGATSSDIGSVTVTNSTGFAEGKNLNVTITYNAFTSESLSTTIPFEVYMQGKKYGGGDSGSTSGKTYASGSFLIFEGQEDTTVRSLPRNFDSYAEYDKMLINIKSEDWAKALGGNYTATITFTAEVVVE